jgi:excisionase family DNA binding protein
MQTLTPKEVAGYLKVPVSNVYHWLKNGELGYFKVGQRYRIPTLEINNFMKRNNKGKEVKL